MSANTPRKPQPSPLDRFTARLDEWFFLTDEPKTLAFVRKELAADGCKTSLDSLSRWRRRRSWQREQTELNDWSEEMEEKCRAFNPNASADQVRQFVISELIKKGAATGDDSLALNAARMQLEELSAKTRARHKEQELAQSERKLKLLEQKAAQFDQAKEVMNSTLSPEEQRQRLKDILK